MALSFHWDSGQVQGPQTHISCVDEDDADGPSCSGLNNYITMASCVVCAASASLFCKADACFLCAECDRTIHSANVVASRHVRCSFWSCWADALMGFQPKISCDLAAICACTGCPSVNSASGWLPQSSVLSAQLPSAKVRAVRSCSHATSAPATSVH